jgi:hypothetical protein
MIRFNLFHLCMSYGVLYGSLMSSKSVTTQKNTILELLQVPTWPTSFLSGSNNVTSVNSMVNHQVVEEVTILQIAICQLYDL